MSRRFYTTQNLLPDNLIILNDMIAHHVGKVLRMRKDDPITLFNGNGNDYLAELKEVSKKKVTAFILKKLPVMNESPLFLHLGQVMSKGERMDYAIQKATEMGVNTITPLSSERCDIRINEERLKKRQHHWQQIAISASEQCGRACVPVIEKVAPVTEWVAERKANELGLVLHHRTQQKLSQLPKPDGIRLLIGPEGGLTFKEISLAEQQLFIPTMLGGRVLRTETAPVAALSVVQWLWGDFQ